MKHDKKKKEFEIMKFRFIATSSIEREWTRGRLRNFNWEKVNPNLSSHVVDRQSLHIVAVLD